MATFYYGFKKNFLLAGIFGLFASLTKITGLLLFIPLLWEFLKNYNFNLIRCFNLKLLSIFLIPIGTLGIFLFYYFKFDDFLLFFKAQVWWGRTFQINREHFLLFSNPAIVNFCLDIFFVIFILVIIYFVFKKLRISYGLYMLVSIIIPLSTGTFMSINRFVLVLFPMYILIALIKNQYLKQAWAFFSILFLAMYIILFVNNYWSG